MLLELEEYLNPPRIMKLIITENKLYNVVAKWLDKSYGDLRESASPGSFRFIHYKDENNVTVFLFNRNTGVTIKQKDSLIIFIFIVYESKTHRRCGLP